MVELAGADQLELIVGVGGSLAAWLFLLIILTLILIIYYITFYDKLFFTTPLFCFLAINTGSPVSSLNFGG